MTDVATADMTAAEANAALILSGYVAFGRGDIPSALAVFAEDIFWHVPGRGPLSRDYRGHTEVLGFFEHFMRLSDGTFRIQIDDVLPSVTGSSSPARKARGVAIEAGLLPRSTSGP